MTKPTRFAASTLLATLLAASGVLTATHAEARPVVEHKTIDVSGRKLGSITFANLVLRAETFDDVGVAKDEYVLTILEELRAKGYPTRGGENLVFGKDASKEADFSLGGTITALDCRGQWRNTCGVTVMWELLDRRTDKVIYKVETRHEEDDLDPKLSKQSSHDLLRGALRSLLSRENFVKALESHQATEATEAKHYEPRTIQRCTTGELAMPKASEQVLAASVVVKAGDSVGSGVLVSPDGLVLTAAHVVEGDVSVTLRDGTKHPGRTVRIDRTHDVALVQLDTKQTPCITIRATPATAGEELYAIGAPAGEVLSFSLSRGIVSGSREFDGVHFLQTDASINPGNSGGPLVDTKGQALAIVSWKVVAPGFDGLGFGVPISEALERLSLTIGDQTEPGLGTETEPVVAEVKTFVDTPDPKWQKLEAPADRKQRASWVMPVRAAGFASAAVGLVAAGTSYLIYQVSPDPTPDTYSTFRTINDAGWIFAGIGAVAITASFVFGSSDAKENPTPATTTKVTAGIGPGSVSMKVVY